MANRFVSIWFPYLEADWHLLRHPEKQTLPFVVAAPSHGKMMIVALNAMAHRQGITTGMALADARAIYPSLQVADHVPGLTGKLLTRIAEWCIRFTPKTAVDGHNGIILDATGCTHLWGTDEAYIYEIGRRFLQKGYTIRIAIADTVGTAWAVARYGKPKTVITEGKNAEALMSLPPEALRLDPETAATLHKLGLQQIGKFINMPSPALRRRFGKQVILQLNKALGRADENIIPLVPVEPYQQRLHCLEPIVTAKGIEIALDTMLDKLCHQLQAEHKGLRAAHFISYRVDGTCQQLSIATSHPSHHSIHLKKLFSDKLQSIEPREGIELFVLQAPVVEDHEPVQESFWENAGGAEHQVSELVDRITMRIGNNNIHRYVPDEHYWPERSFREAGSLYDHQPVHWRRDQARPVIMLPDPQLVDVTAPIPDYPPMLFRYKGKLHKIVRADGPERIEQEWWLQEGKHRDYYAVEDEEGIRYWLFRSGHYGTIDCQWYLHGFFA